jgi:heat shock protein HslJ
VTIAFTADSVSGVSACNNYNGPYTVTAQGGLQFGPLATTRKACEPPIAAVETAYLAALERVDAYAVDGDQLVLSAGGTEVLRFDRA